MKRNLIHVLAAAAMLAAAAGGAFAQSTRLSDASALSALPVALSVTAPVALLSTGAMLSVVAVEASAEGVVWVLESASDGSRASVTLGTQAAGTLSVGVGTAVVVSAFSAGWVLSAAGQVLAYIPNEVGRALLYTERVTR